MPIKSFPLRLSAIRTFVDRSLGVNDEYVRALDTRYTEEEWAEYGEAGHDRATDVLLNYQEIVTRAALSELNALVEYELRWLARALLRQAAGSEDSRLSRGAAVRVIEQCAGVQLATLPGASEVEEIRKVVNAHKHEDGYSGRFEPFFTGTIETRYELDPEKIHTYLDSVSAFLSALPGSRLNLGDDVRVGNR